MSVASQHSPAGSRQAASREVPEALARRVVVEHIQPEIDGGRFPIKRTPGEFVDVAASIFADGHDMIAAMMRDRASSSASAASSAPSEWRETPMVIEAPGTDRWTARFAVDGVGWHEYQIVAWVDRFMTWRRDVKIKAAAGQDIALELLEGSLLVRDAGGRAHDTDSAWLLEMADALSDSTPPAERVALALGHELAAAMLAYADRSRATESAPLRVWVDRERARFGAWYEMFPRSAGPDPRRSGTFVEARAALSRIADLGFDVIYLPPIHPIGTSFRKGRNNALQAGPGDPGSPWAIGDATGGHDAIHPDLGTLDEFDALVAEGRRVGVEICLDFAIQCSADHPWLTDHPEWFNRRPDGTLKYAENPPKKYQDIYNVNWQSEDWRHLWQALLDVVLFWVTHGVRVFRVDNPHTKPIPFWEWLIRKVRAQYPDVVFLAEAFTRRAVMRQLAKLGFSQSYTYYTWKNGRLELTEYVTELATSGSSTWNGSFGMIFFSTYCVRKLFCASSREMPRTVCVRSFVPNEKNSVFVAIWSAMMHARGISIIVPNL